MNNKIYWITCRVIDNIIHVQYIIYNPSHQKTWKRTFKKTFYGDFYCKSPCWWSKLDKNIQDILKIFILNKIETADSRNRNCLLRLNIIKKIIEYIC